MYRNRMIRTKNLPPIEQDQQEVNKEVINNNSMPSKVDSIVISNLTDRYSLNYGRDFGGMLDARDQVMEH